MEERTIDCTGIYRRDDLHRIFRESLDFPDWYGNNLDALYDCLTEISGKVRLLDWETAEERLGAYGKKQKQSLQPLPCGILPWIYISESIPLRKESGAGFRMFFPFSDKLVPEGSS